MRRSRIKIKLPASSYEERCAAREAKPTFTPQEIANWKDYEFVRAEGRYNMFDPNARTLTGLSRADYAFCMDNYSALKAAAQ